MYKSLDARREILSLGLELFLTDIQIEISNRKALAVYNSGYALSSPEVVEAYLVTSGYCTKYMKLERRYKDVLRRLSEEKARGRNDDGVSEH